MNLDESTRTIPIIIGGRPNPVFPSSEFSKILKETTIGITPISSPAIPMEAEKLTSKRPGFAGGIRALPIHYDGETYLLTEKQWIEFSQKVIERFQKKLTHAKGVNFDQLMKLSDVMSEIVSYE